VEKTRKDLPDHQAILRGILRRHKKLVAGIFLGLGIPLLAGVYLTSKPLYVSTATIAIETSALEQIPFFKDLPKKDNIATHMVLLKSRSLGEAVIDALPKESFDELLTHSQHADYLLLLSNRVKQWIGEPPTVFSPQQRALAEIQNARMEFVQAPQALGIITIKGTASSSRVAMDLVNTYIQMLLGRTRNINQEEARKSREFLEQQIQLSRENLNKAEETLTKFQQQKGRIRLGSQTELDLVKLSQTENALAEAQASREVTSARIAGLRQALGQAKTKETRGAAENQAKEKEKDEAAAPPRSGETLAQFNAFKVAQENLARLEAKLVAMRERYTDAHPMVQITQEQVTKEQARVAQMAHALPAAPVPSEPRAARTTQAAPSERSELERQLAALETEEGALQAKVETFKIQVDRLRKNLRNVNQEELEFSNLRQTVESNRNLLTVLSDKLMAARIREQGEAGVIRIIDPASFPLQPTQSKTFRFALMVLAFAGSLALGAAYGIEFLRQPVETESDVQKATGLAVLGSIGMIRGKDDRKQHGRTRSAALPAYLPNSSLPPSVHAELYRAIRATVEAERLKSPFRSILVTSPGPHEGKSTTVLNLAHVFREFGRRVLVIEADLRRPTFQRTLSLTNKPDLGDYLNGAATFEQVCRILPSGVTVIPCQAIREDSASMMLASPRLKELLEQAYAQFDVVLVDSPPLLAVSDNLLLVTVLDRAILVVKASATSKRDLRKAEAALRQNNVEILGVILNQAHPHDVGYYQPRYHKYYKSPENKTTPPPRRSGLVSWGKKR
jgi:polysaccharide biosynthesis transport protein